MNRNETKHRIFEKITGINFKDIIIKRGRSDNDFTVFLAGYPGSSGSSFLLISEIHFYDKNHIRYIPYRKKITKVFKHRPITLKFSAGDIIDIAGIPINDILGDVVINKFIKEIGCE